MAHLHIDHMDEKTITQVEERMRCGPHHPVCFLGERESLRDIIRRDGETLSRYGADYAQVGRMLGEIVAHPEQHPEVQVEHLESPLECPFEPGTVYMHSNQTFLVRMRGEEISFPGLLLHMVAAHQFFGGINSPYRLDPEQAIRMLQLHERPHVQDDARSEAKNSI